MGLEPTTSTLQVRRATHYARRLLIGEQLPKYLQVVPTSDEN